MKRAVRMGMALLCVGASAYAETVRAEEPTSTWASAQLSLDDVVMSAEQAYPLLRAAELENKIAVADMKSAEGSFDLSWRTRGTITPVGYYESVRVESVVEKPTAIWGSSVFAGYKLGTGKFAVYDGGRQTLEYGEVRAGVNVPLVRNGPTDRRRASLERAELGLDIAKLSVTEQRIQVRRSAAHRYWNWVAAGQRLRLAEELLRIVEGRDAGLATRVERGDLPRFERTDNARAVEQRKAQIALSRRGIEQAAIELGLFLRDEKGDPAPPALDRMPRNFPQVTQDEPDDAAAIGTALAERPENRRLQLQWSQQHVERRYARNQLWPALDLQLAGSQDIGREMVGRPDLSKPVFEASLLLDVPLQTRVMDGRAEAAEVSMRRLVEQQRFMTDRIRADVRDALSGVRRARERIDATRKEVALAEELEAAERTRFEQGDSHLLIVNLREQQTAEARLREVDALLDYFRSKADLRAAQGK
ncbi:MAG: TolC family protein [Polyangiaceae bacterium]